jgi:Mg-chelatase subunit ChlD
MLALSTLLTACSKRPEEAGSELTTVTTRELDVGGLVKMREERRTVGPEEEIVDEAVNEMKRPQAGNLTAGDHDDILNPTLYARYASAVVQQNGELPFVDTRSLVAVRVVDAVGRAVPQARIEVARPGGALHLVSGADGSASFYPRYDRAGSQTRISISSDAGSISRAVRLRGHGVQTVMLTVPGRGRPVDALDLVLVLDTTGSMGDEMAYLQAEMASIISRLKRDAGNLDIQIGLVVYRDRGDDYVTRSFPLSRDMRSVQSTLDQQDADGGGDMPEAVDRALVAAEHMQWRPEAAKAVLLVADAPPHREALGATLKAVEHLRGQGVRIVPVAASGAEDSAQYVMRAMAVLTGGRYIFLTDDSGIGNGHAEPDIACYVVTRLDQLIARVLAGIVEGHRVEPKQSEVIRTVGNYDRGRCGTAQIAAR